MAAVVACAPWCRVAQHCTSRYFSAAASTLQLRNATPLFPLPQAQGANVITLSGWIAAAALAAMGMVVIVGAYLGIKRLVAPSRPYTVVATRDGDA